jgi:hypothetical protein
MFKLRACVRVKHFVYSSLCNARHTADRPTPGENQFGDSAESRGKTVTNAFAGVAENLIGTISMDEV